MLKVNPNDPRTKGWIIKAVDRDGNHRYFLEYFRASAARKAKPLIEMRYGVVVVDMVYREFSKGELLAIWCCRKEGPDGLPAVNAVLRLLYYSTKQGHSCRLPQQEWVGIGI